MSNDYDPNYIPVKDYFLVGVKAIIFKEENKFLIVRRSDKTAGGGLWSLPGGAIEKGEDVYSAIVREIVEETQLTVENIKPFDIWSFNEKDSDSNIIIGFKCILKSGTPTLNWEHTEYSWITSSELPKYELTPTGKFFLSKL